MSFNTGKSTLSAATAYLKRGWLPVPIPAGTKAPLLTGWQSLRLKEADLHGHFEQGANIGLLLGEPSGGLVDVDIDHPSALRLAGLLPATERIHGRGRNPNSHYWYRCTGELPATTRFRDPVTGETLIEFRSTGGQTVVPPSAYLIDGVADPLTWSKEGEPAQVDGAELLNDVAHLAARALLVKHYPSEPGSRHDIALALAGFLLRGGMPQLDVERLVQTVCEHAGDEEAEDRVKAVAGTAGRLEAGQSATGRRRLAEYFDPRVVGKVSEWLGLTRATDEVSWETPIPFDEVRVPDFSADILPGEFGGFAKALAEAAEVPESMTTMAVLGAISAAATKKFEVVPKSGWRESLNIYTMVALPPANNKSLVLREAVQPIESWEFDRNLAMRDEIQMATSTRRNEESTIDSLRHRAAKAKDPAMRKEMYAEVNTLEASLTQVPVPPKVYLNDVTPESLSSAIEEQNGRISIISDEGGITETLAGLYSGGKANFDIVLKGYDGGRVRLKRKEREIDMRPYISVLLFVQPQVLRNMAQQKAFTGRGLFERFLYLLPNSKLGHRTLDTEPVSEQARRAYATGIRRLLDLDVPNDGRGNDLPRPLSLEPEAEKVWNQFRADIEKELGPEGRLHACAGWGGKIPGTCVRIAGLLHVAEYGAAKSAIAASAMQRAIVIAKALLEHAIAAFAMMQTDQTTQDAETIHQWLLLRGEPRFGRTDCLKKFHGRFTNKKRFADALESLQHHNVIGEVHKETNPGTGKGRKYYEVNPMVFDRKG